MSIKFTSNNTDKTVAEPKDISCWPVATRGEPAAGGLPSTTWDMLPGKRYNLGSLTDLSYQLLGGKDGSEWYFTFDSPANATRVIHPDGVNFYDFEVKPNSRVEVSILQFGDGTSARKELIGICREIK